MDLSHGLIRLPFRSSDVARGYLEIVTLRRSRKELRGSSTVFYRTASFEVASGLRLLICFLSGFLIPLGTAVADSPMGDRMLVSINNKSYSQRQMEVFFAVKECLRRDGQPVRLVDAVNWQVAFDVFSEDMIVSDESLRVGSFRSTVQQRSKYVKQVGQCLQKDLRVKAHYQRLGTNLSTLQGTVDTIIRLVAFRQSKNRQASISDGQVAGGAPIDSPQWLIELKNRTVVRRYENADQYMLIQPNLGQTHGSN